MEKRLIKNMNFVMSNLKGMIYTINLIFRDIINEKTYALIFF